MYRKRKWKCMWNVLRIILPRPCCADNWHTPHQPPNWKALRLNQFPFIHFTLITCKLFPSHHVDTFALIQKQHLSLLASLQLLLPSNYYYAPRAHLTSLLQLESAIPASILVGVQIQLLQRNLQEVFRFWISSFKASLHPIIVANVKALEINSNNLFLAFKVQTSNAFSFPHRHNKSQTSKHILRKTFWFIASAMFMSVFAACKDMVYAFIFWPTQNRSSAAIFELLFVQIWSK